MRRSRSGARSHRRNIGGFENEYARRTRMSAGRRYVNNDRHRGTRDLLDDIAGGTDQSPRSIDLDQYSLVIPAGSLLDRPTDVFAADRLIRVIHNNPENLR